jgi:hypothetical protein
MTALRLDWASPAAMRHACLNWHYAKAVPTPPRLPVGVWEHGRYVGVVIFSRGAAPHLGRAFGLAHTQIAELTRVALREHETPVSRIVTIAVRLLRKQAPGVRLVVSYADPLHGHHGGIYQAMNWVYLGTSQPAPVYIDANGREWHSRMISPTGYKKVYGRRRRVPTPAECTVRHDPGKHKYALALDADVAALLAPLARAYPSRAADSDGAAPATSRQRGGSTPTRPLATQAPGTNEGLADEHATALRP